MKTQLTKNIVFTFFSGQATSLQKKLIEEWLVEPRNKEQYYEWLEEWERLHPQYITDMEAGLEKFFLHRDTVEFPIKATVSSHSAYKKRWLWYAASVILLLAVSVYLGADLVQYKTYATDYGEVKHFVLDDGSKISLNANSVLRIPRFGFGTQTRDVFLKGEAEFSVVHTNDHKKFLVHTPDKLEVEVLGTKFIVYSRERGSKVVLNEGKVLLRAMNDTLPLTMAIKPGDVVTVQNGVIRKKEQQPVQAHTAWKEHRFIFDQTSLEEIAYQVEENFGLRIQITDTLLAKRQLTGTYEAENADDLIDVLSRMLDLEIERNGKKVIIHSR